MSLVLKKEGLEAGNGWMWWQLGNRWTEHMISQLPSDSPQKHTKSKTRRSFAGITRVSDRMIKWVLESMFMPKKLNWALDEIFFRTVCEMKPECVYVPMNSIHLGDAGAVDTTASPMKLAGKPLEWLAEHKGKQLYSV